MTERCRKLNNFGIGLTEVGQISPKLGRIGPSIGHISTDFGQVWPHSHEFDQHQAGWPWPARRSVRGNFAHARALQARVSRILRVSGADSGVRGPGTVPVQERRA